jgi:hypothetical protein
MHEANNLNSSLGRIKGLHDGSAIGVLEDAARAAVFSAIQEPINGVTQMIDAVVGTAFLPKVQFIEAPEPARFGTLNWHAQQLGSAAGTLLPFMLVNKGIRGLSGVATVNETSLLGRQTILGMGMKDAALTGFIYDGVFRPSDEKSSGTQFLIDRGTQGLVGAGTFMTITATGLGLNSLASMPALEKSAFRSVLTNSIGHGILSGIPAGLYTAEAQSLTKTGNFATISEMGQSVYGMSLIGGSLAAVHSFKTANARSVQELAETARFTKLNDGDIAKLWSNEEFTSTPPCKVPGEFDGLLWHPKYVIETANVDYINGLQQLMESNYALMKPEIRETFVKDFDQLTRKWENDNYARADELKVIWDMKSETLNRYSEMVLRALENADPSLKDSDVAKQMLLDTSTLRQIMQSNEAKNYGVQNLPPSDLAIIKATEINNIKVDENQKRWQQEDPLKLKMNDLQLLLNKITDLVEIPRIDIEMKTDLRSSAMYLHGKISLEDYVLNYGKPEVLCGLVFHEVLHGEQQYRMVRKLADDRQLTSADNEATEALQSAWAVRIERALPEDYARKALERRNDIRLPDAEREPIENLTDAHRMNQRYPLEYNRSTEIVRYIDALTAKLQFHGISGLKEILTPGTVWNNDFHNLAGRIENILPESEKVSWLNRLSNLQENGLQNSNSRNTAKAVQNEMRALLEGGIRLANTWRQTAYQKYAGLRHESDTQWAGFIVEKEFLNLRSSSSMVGDTGAVRLTEGHKLSN